MSEAERERLAMELFSVLCDEPPDRRSALLAERCPDADLRGRVEGLLAVDSGGIDVAADRFLDAAVADRPAPPRPADDLAGGELDGGGSAYRILRVVGEGGMGTVYEAEQVSPRRRVAIKAIRNDLGSPAGRKRFEAEAQTLARLEHPGIARLYEADARPEEGHIRAYLAMEFVDGLPLDQYASGANLNVDALLDLFLRVCEPIAYAHRRGVIHRDLKPANILVCADGQPKVLDFGVARTLDGIDTVAGTRLTFAGQIIGTLSYMSPEQLDGQAPVDARADVYALGVILYELLAHRLPIDTRTAGLAQAAHRVLTEVPQPLGRLDRRLRGDLEAIVGKALEKDPDRRYPSVTALTAEIRRFQQGLPIEARGDSVLYRLQRSAWRHRRAVALSTLFVALAAGLSLVETARRRAERLKSDETHQLAGQAARDRAAADAARFIAEQADALYRKTLYESGIAAARSEVERGSAGQARTILDKLPVPLRNLEWTLLDRMADRSNQTLDVAGGDRVLVVAADRGLRIVAAGCQTGRYRVVSAADGRILLEDQQSTPVQAIAVAPDGQRVAVQSADGLAVRSIGNAGQNWSAAFSPLAQKQRTVVPQVQFSPDGRLLAWAKADGTLTVSRAEDGRTVRDLGNMAKLRDFAFTPDGAGLIVGTTDGVIRRLGVDGALPVDCGQRAGGLWKLVVSPDGKAVATLGTGTTPVILHDLETLRERGRIVGNWTQLLLVRFAADGNTLITAGFDGRLQSLDVELQAIRETYVGHQSKILEVMVSPDGRRILSASADGAVKTWDLPLRPLAIEASTGLRTTALARFPDTEDEALIGSNSGLIAWNFRTSTRTQDYHDEGREVGIAGVAVERTGQFIAAGCRDGCIRIWRRDGQLLQRRRVPGYSISSLAFTPDGQNVAACNADGRLILHPVTDGPPATGAVVIADRAAPDATGGRNLTFSLTFSPNGSRLAIGDASGAIRLWSWPELNLLQEITDGEDGVRRLVFSPDGKWIASASHQPRVVVRDAATLLPARVITWTFAGASSLAFNPASDRLMLGCYDGKLRLCSTETGAELLTLDGDRQEQFGTFMDGGKSYLFVDLHGNARIWGP